MNSLPGLLVRRTGHGGLFDDFFKDVERSLSGGHIVKPLARPFAADLIETANAFLLELDLPGCSKEAIDVSFEDGQLSVSVAETDSASEEHRYLHRERVARSGSRSFRIPETADSDSIEAQFENGVLKIMIQKLPEKAPKKVEIS